jgi:hypothetical protein
MKAYALVFSALFLFGSLGCDMKSSELVVAGKIGEILVVTDKGVGFERMSGYQPYTMDHALYA